MYIKYKNKKYEVGILHIKYGDLCKDLF